MRWLKDRDANSRLFHAVANGRRTKNFIANIRVGDEVITDQNRKEEAFFEACNGLLGQIQNRDAELDLEELGLPSYTENLASLAAIFTEDDEEVCDVIKELPSDRAPGTDGFVGAFYQRAWPTIKQEIMAGVLKLFVGDGRDFIN
jgi:mannosylglycoprotein endo-beta-mannosidase